MNLPRAAAPTPPPPKKKSKAGLWAALAGGVAVVGTGIAVAVSSGRKPAPGTNGSRLGCDRPCGR